jgi:ParB family chromosome partitioning protein
MSDHPARVPVAHCRPDPRQPRTYFRKSALAALAQSIKTLGQRTPIEVRALPAGDAARFEIIDGERRWRACQLAGVKTIRICVEQGEIDHQRQHFLSVVSNFHREGHTHTEISAALQYQVECAKGAKGIVRDLANNLGKSEAWVYQYLSLQGLVPELQEKMHPETSDRELLRFGEALVLASIPPEHQRYVYLQLLELPVKSRLKHARDAAAEITGRQRSGRPVSIKRHMERFTARLQSDMDRVMEFRQSDFNRAVQQVPGPELRRFRDSLKRAAEHLQLLTAATERALKR